MHTYIPQNPINCRATLRLVIKRQSARAKAAPAVAKIRVRRKGKVAHEY